MDQKTIEKAKEAKSAAELAKIAHEEGVNLSDAEADRYYAQLHQDEGELTSEELSNVSGGECGETEDEKRKHYEEHPFNYVCSDHTWSYLVYTGMGAVVMLPEGRRCSNCHYGVDGK
jgi:hypothetical protein